MKHFRNYIMAALGLVIVTVVATVSVTESVRGQGMPKPLNVLVGNDSTNPVPTTLEGVSAVGGTVSVDNFPALQAVEGTVSVDSLPAVVLAPPRIEPVIIGSSAHVYLGVTCPYIDTTVFTVPAGKLLIIEDASASAVSSADPSGSDPTLDVSLIVSTRMDPSNRFDNVIVADVGVPVAGGRTMKAYAGPGTDVWFIVSGCSAAVNASFRFSGQLVEFPTP